MKENIHTANFFAIILFSILAFVITPGICSAEEWNRTGRGEVFAFGQSMGGDTAIGFGISLDLDDTIVGGFGVGTNVNDHINLNTDMFFGSTDIMARGFGGTLRGDTTLIGWNANIDINILKDNVTPMVTGGVGFIAFRGDYNTGLTFQETDFSYNLGAGVRWDASDHFLIKSLYRVTWTELEDTDGAIRFDGINLSVGYIF